MELLSDIEGLMDLLKKDGFKNMIHDGIEKVFAGITTFEEILRTTRTA